MRTFRSRWLAALILGVVCLGVGVGPSRPADLQAQSPDDWTTPYRPALLPEFVSDMAAYADAPRYDITMTLVVTPDEATIAGHQVVRYTNRNTDTPLSEIVFRLYPNLPSYGGEMQVSAITADGVSAEPTLDDTRSVLHIPLPVPLAPGQTTMLEMDFTTVVTAGVYRLYDQFSYLDGVLALPNAYPVLSVYEPGDGWWQVAEQPQGDAVYSETAFFQVDVTAPSDLILAASGTEVDITLNATDTITHHYVAPLMRDFALMGSTEYVALTGTQDGVTITLYYDPDSTPNASASATAGLQMTQNAVRIYNAAYGRYPFVELDVVQTPTSAGGIEYPGLFVVATSVWNKEDDFFEFVIAHEAAHQWWYSLVGNDQTLEPWIDEALAQFSVALYIRDLEGVDAYSAALASFQYEYERFIELYDDQVIGLPVTAYPDAAYFYIIYQKAPVFYSALGDAYGHDMVVLMLQDLFATYRYGIIETDDIVDSFEATLGEDLDTLFQEWVGVFPVG